MSRRIPHSVAGWENPADLMYRQMAEVQKRLLPQAILVSGVLVDVYPSNDSEVSDSVYGSYAGQKLETTPSVRTRVLGLPTTGYRVSKDQILSGFFEGAECFILEESEIRQDDVLVEVGTQVKWIVVHPKVIGTAAGRSLYRLTVASMME